MNVMIIPEDFRRDQYILYPLFSQLFYRLIGRNAHIKVCQNPRLGGIGEALKPERLREIVEQFGGMIDIFILCVDRDGVLGRRQRLDQIEDELLPSCTNCVFLAENAWEELETWALAGLDLPSEWRWADVRAAEDVKERYFEPLAAQRGFDPDSDDCRRKLGEAASRRIPAIRQKCPEDFDSLARRLAIAVQTI